MELARCDDPAQALEFFVGQNGGAAQGSDQFLAVDKKALVIVGGNNAAVIGVLAVNEFCQKLNFTEREAGLLRPMSIVTGSSLSGSSFMSC